MKFKNIYNYSSKLSVLYVEDDMNLLTETSDILEDYFCELQSACDGLDGLTKFLEYKEETNRYFDLIITDINMPNMDGLKMIQKIHSHNPDQEVLVISAYSDASRLIDLIHEGISSFILKPLKSKHFMNSLYNVCQSIVYKKEREMCLHQQLKMASVGEMMESIAHQWKHSLNVMKMQEGYLTLQNELNTVDTKVLDDYINVHAGQINHLVQTLDQFRNFFSNEDNIESVSIKEIIDEVLVLMKDRLMAYGVVVSLDIALNKTIKVVKNEFKHVFINLLNNSIDAFVMNNIDTHNRNLNIFLSHKEENCILSIADNAGGIPENQLENVFNKEFTTKKNGSGIGLSFVVKILEKIGASISVKNENGGATFDIVLKS